MSSADSLGSNPTWGNILLLVFFLVFSWFCWICRIYRIYLQFEENSIHILWMVESRTRSRTCAASFGNNMVQTRKLSIKKLENNVFKNYPSSCCDMNRPPFCRPPLDLIFFINIDVLQTKLLYKCWYLIYLNVFNQN